MRKHIACRHVCAKGRTDRTHVAFVCACILLSSCLYDHKLRTFPSYHCAHFAFSKYKIGRWHESEPGHLALPKGIDVIFVDRADQLQRIEDALAMLKDSEPSAWVVGLDAEWSSYTSASRCVNIRCNWFTV